MVDQFDLAAFILYGVSFSIFFRVLDAVLIEPVDGINVTQTSEGTGGRLEGRVERLDERSGNRVSKEDIDGFADLRVVTCEFVVVTVRREVNLRHPRYVP